MSLVIADADPLIVLSGIGKLFILKKLFQQIVITETVRDEIFVNDHQQGKNTIQDAINSAQIQVVSVDLSHWKTINAVVDEGESSAIFLACHTSCSSLLIMDDQAGRAEARYRNISIIGTAAIIGIAKEQGIIDSAKAVLDEPCLSG